jgi:Fe(3+) dicitrate transport protein
LGEALEWSHNPYLQVAYTWLPTAETTTPFRCLAGATGTAPAACPGGNVFGSQAGKRAPYAPEHLLSATLGYTHASGFDARVETVFVADQFSDFANFESAAQHPDSVQARSGQYGKIADYAVVNLAGTYPVQRDLNLYVSIKNLLDHRYIVDRVRGILPGSPRLVQAGFRYDF